MDTAEKLMRKEQQRKLENFRNMNKSVKKGAILFTGSSLMEMFPVEVNISRYEGHRYAFEIHQYT